MPDARTVPRGAAARRAPAVSTARTTSTCCDGRGARPCSGRVALWGRVIEHELGYRARYGYPQRLRLICQFCFWQWGTHGVTPTVRRLVPAGRAAADVRRPRRDGRPLRDAPAGVAAVRRDRPATPRHVRGRPAARSSGASSARASARPSGWRCRVAGHRCCAPTGSAARSRPPSPSRALRRRARLGGGELFRHRTYGLIRALCRGCVHVVIRVPVAFAFAVLLTGPVAVRALRRARPRTPRLRFVQPALGVASPLLRGREAFLQRGEHAPGIHAPWAGASWVAVSRSPELVPQLRELVLQLAVPALRTRSRDDPPAASPAPPPSVRAAA